MILVNKDNEIFNKTYYFKYNDIVQVLDEYSFGFYLKYLDRDGEINVQTQNLVYSIYKKGDMCIGNVSIIERKPTPRTDNTEYINEYEILNWFHVLINLRNIKINNILKKINDSNNH